MRFHFDLINGKTNPDRFGQELDDAVQAAEIADKLAETLVVKDPALAAKGYSVLVTDEDGQEVHRIRLKELVH